MKRPEEAPKMSVLWRPGLLALSDGSVFEGEVLAAPEPGRGPGDGPGRGSEELAPPALPGRPAAKSSSTRS